MNLGSSLEVSRGNEGKFVLFPEQLQSDVNRYPDKAAKQTLSFRYGFNTAMPAGSVASNRALQKMPDMGACWNSV